MLRDELDEMERRAQLALRCMSSSDGMTDSSRICFWISRRWRTASMMLPVPASPPCGHGGAFTTRRSASSRQVAPHTNGTL